MGLCRIYLRRGGLWHAAGTGRETTVLLPLVHLPDLRMLATLIDSSRARETQLMRTFQRERTSDSFEALYRAAAPGLLKWIEQSPVVRTAALDAREALQDTFVNIYRYAASFRPEASGGFRAWARTIAGNAVRRARRRPLGAGVAFADHPSAMDAEADRRSSPAECALDAEEARELRGAYALMLQHYAAAFATLKDRDQRALHMVEVEGLTYAEVGARLSVGRSNTKMIVFRARQRLRLALQASLGMDEPAQITRCA